MTHNEHLKKKKKTTHAYITFYMSFIDTFLSTYLKLLIVYT